MLTLQNVKLEISEYSNTTKIILSNTLSFFWKKNVHPIFYLVNLGLVKF